LENRNLLSSAFLTDDASRCSSPRQLIAWNCDW